MQQAIHRSGVISTADTISTLDIMKYSELKLDSLMTADEPVINSHLQVLVALSL